MALARSYVPALALLLFSAVSVAQKQPAQQPAGGTAGSAVPPATAAAPASASPSASGSPSATSDAPAAPKVSATGYGYSDTAQPKAGRVAPAGRRHVVHPSGPVATLPGFEMLADGGSRLFVQLSPNVPVEEKRAAGTVTYVLKGAHVVKHNNQNALVTVHFNTPVSRARLVPRGRDLLFVVELRANAQPAWKIEAAKDNSAILAIDFPKGNFLPNAPQAPPPPDSQGDDGENQTVPEKKG